MGGGWGNKQKQIPQKKNIVHHEILFFLQAVKVNENLKKKKVFLFFLFFFFVFKNRTSGGLYIAPAFCSVLRGCPVKW